jgi:gamma-glutamyltranspeptidase/glutathione hydrolase
MRRARLLAGGVFSAFLAACSSGIDVPGVGDITGSSTPPAQTGGVVVGEVPLAVQSAAAVLNEGGSAADAATAMYFVLAVTYPQAAGLGGGGVCLAHDPKTQRNVQYEFLPRAPSGRGPYAVPGNVRGFEALQRDFGSLAWSRDVVAGERLAEIGFPISQALEDRLVASQNAVRLDASLAGLFMDESGQIKPKGTLVGNPALATMLSAIRTRGSSALYRDDIADRIAGYSAQQGGALSASDLASYAVAGGTPDVTAHDGITVVLPNARSGTATFALGFFRGQGGTAQSKDMMKDLVASVGTAADDTGATGFAARDVNGQAVACAVTMNGAFGSGHSVPDTGVTLARAPDTKGVSPAAAMLAPAIALDGNGNAVLVAAGAGSIVATASLYASVMRITRGATPVEAKPDPSDPGTLDVIQCSGVCTATPDARGTGLGVSTGS